MALRVCFVEPQLAGHIVYGRALSPCLGLGENRELRRAKEILKDASIFLATELEGRTKR